MRCSNYEFALNIKCKYHGLSRNHNHLSELTEPGLSGLHCISLRAQTVLRGVVEGGSVGSKVSQLHIT